MISIFSMIKILLISEFNLFTVPTASGSSNAGSSNRIRQAADTLERMLKSGSCAIYNGEVYKKVKDSKYTYVAYKSIKKYIMESLSDPIVAETILPVINQFINLSSDPDCGLIRNLEIDFNFIECQPYGVCFDIEKKSFIKDPINLKGSPRAFSYYQFTGEVPYPKFFIEGKTLYTKLFKYFQATTFL